MVVLPHLSTPSGFLVGAENGCVFNAHESTTETGSHLAEQHLNKGGWPVLCVNVCVSSRRLAYSLARLTELRFGSVRIRALSLLPLPLFVCAHMCVCVLVFAHEQQSLGRIHENPRVAGA